MKTIRPDRLNFKEIILKTVGWLKQGKVIVCPTDTVYGLLADARNQSAVERLYVIKQRDFKKPVPIFVKDINQAKKIARLDRKKEKFLIENWPGKTTVVLKRKKKSFRLYGVDAKTIALRIPACQLVNSLLEKTGFPLTGTSANIAGQPASTKISQIRRQFAKQKFRPDIIIDVGNLKPARPSKIIDLTGPRAKVLRP